jgi:hypothetical protein
MGKPLLIIVTTAGLLASTPARAEPVIGLGFRHLDLDNHPEYGALEIADLSVGYRFDRGDGLSLTPELRIGSGLTDNAVNGAPDSFYGFGLRGEIESANTYLFLNPTYTRYDPSLGLGDTTATSPEWESGVGVGAGVRVGRHFVLEIGYEKYKRADSVGLAFRVEF